jgi:hypothetical protein
MVPSPSLSVVLVVLSKVQFQLSKIKKQTEKGESFLKLGDLLFGKLISHCESILFDVFDLCSITVAHGPAGPSMRNRRSLIGTLFYIKCRPFHMNRYTNNRFSFLMTVNFNNVRKQAVYAYERLVERLNSSIIKDEEQYENNENNEKYGDYENAAINERYGVNVDNSSDILLQEGSPY